MRSRALRTVLLALACVSTAVATEAPPVEVRIVNPRPAMAGEVYEGVFEVIVGHPGLVQDFEIVGQGWAVLEARLPEGGFYNETTLLIPFKARPTDVEARIGLKLAYECQKLTRTFALGPAAFASHGKGHLSVRRTPVAAPSELPTEGAPATRGAGNIRVTGRIVYDRAEYDSNNDGDLDDPNDQPALPGVGVDTIRVRLLDDDGLSGEETIWEGFTSPYGYFDSGDVFWDDCDITGCDDPDLILEYEAHTGVVDVTDNSIWEDTYYFRTPEMTDFTGSFYDYGDQAPSNAALMPALHIFNSIVRTHRYIENTVGIDVPSVQVEWPDENLGNAGAHYEPSGAEIHVSSVKQWWEATHSHEYGHHFMHVFSTTVPPDYCNYFCDGEVVCTAGLLCEDAGHCPDCPENDHDAWNEGWPNWLADVVTRYIGTYTNDDGSFYRPLVLRDQEGVGLCCQDNALHLSDADEVESFVGAMLRDIEDSNFDWHAWNTDTDRSYRDMLCLGPDEIFEVVTLLHPTTIDQFLDGFATLNPEHDAALRLTAWNVAPSYAALINLPPDTQPMGPITSIDSVSHPLGQGGYSPCVTVVWDPPVDDVNGACGYSFAWGDTAQVAPDDTFDPIDSLGCQLATTDVVTSPGSRYFTIKASECNAGFGGTELVGPFEVLDCNGTGLIDLCDISCSHPGTASCDLDFDDDGLGDTCLVAGCGQSLDCQSNGVPDECDLASGTSLDCNENGVPDECELMKHWGGGTGGWNTAGDWIEGAVPSSGDHVCIRDDAADATVSYTSGSTSVPILSCTESLRVANGSLSATLTLTEPSWIDGDLTLINNSSTLGVGARLDVGGTFSWTGSNSTSAARLTGAGETHVYGGLEEPSGNVRLDGHDLFLEPGSSSTVYGQLSASNGATLTVRPGATLDYRGNTSLISGTTATLNLEGTLLKSTDPGIGQVNSFLQNDGLVHVLDGTFRARAGSNTTGAFLADPGTTLEFYCGNHTFGPGSTITAERVDFTGGNCGSRSIHGTYDVSARTYHNSSSPLTFHADANVVSFGTELILSGGLTTIDAVVGHPLVFDNVVTASTAFNGGDPIVTQNLTLGGTLSGSSDITVDGLLTWPAGSSFSGTGVVNSNGTLTVGAGGSQKHLYPTLNVGGLAIFNGAFTAHPTTAINVLPGATVDLRVDGTLIAGGETSPLNNTGTLVKTAGAGTSTLFPLATNTGLIESRTGTLTFRRLTQTAGTILLNGGNVAMYQTSTPQPMNLEGGTLAGSGTVTGVIDNTGASVEPGLSAGTLTFTHSYTQGAGARLVVELGGTIPGTDHDQLVLTGAATATLAGTLRVELINGFVPEVGALFDVLVAPTVVGAFDTIDPVGFPADRAVRVLDNTGGIRLQIYDPLCDGVVAGGLAQCPDAICPHIDDSVGEPLLLFDDPAACPAGVPLTGGIDFAQGRLSSLAVGAGGVALGPVAPVLCGGTLDAFLWTGPPAGAGDVDFYIVRTQGESDYGQASSGEPRLAGFGDCP